MELPAGYTVRFFAGILPPVIFLRLPAEIPVK
jgi:hypothetical protein